MKLSTPFLFLLFVSFSTPGFAQGKKRVAILDFDYSTVQSNAAAIFGSNNDIGKGVADMLIEKLVSSGSYSLVERKMIDKIMAEQNFSNSDRADAASAAKLGRLLGADAIVVGSITQFGRDDKQANFGGSAISGVAGRYGLGGIGTKKSKAVVGLTARVVGTDTAEILAVSNGKGESTRSGTSLLGSGGSAGTAVTGLSDMTSTNFANTILGEAVGMAVAGLAKQLDATASNLPARTVTIDGLVADVSGDTVVVNVGSRAGLKVGDKLQVKRTGREIRDPATGKVLRRIEESLGELTITEVDEGSGVGRYSGAGKLQVGDSVRSGG